MIAQASGGSGKSYVATAKMSFFLGHPCCNFPHCFLICLEEASIGLVKVGANAGKELAFNVINDYCSGVDTCCGARDEEEDNVNVIVPP